MRITKAIKFLLAGFLASGYANAAEKQPAPPVVATSQEIVATSLKPATKPAQAMKQAPAQTDGRSVSDLLSTYQIQLDPPGSERLFRLESEDSLRERMRQEKRSLDQLERLNFPSDVSLTNRKYDAQWRSTHWAIHDRKVEPFYLTYDKLFFMEINSERYGWDLGFAQPFVSTAVFFFDFAFLPYKMASDSWRRYDSNAGYCLPGDPVPYMWYPPNVSVTGTVSELATIALLIAVFP
ncbi:MAG: hypothetical protein RL595_396 [Planctomycetota bacterium]|jgi:hypothetical protein